MNIGPLNRWAVVGVVLAVLLVNLQPATSQSSMRVQSTTRYSSTPPAIDKWIAACENDFREAIDLAVEFARTDPALGKRIEDDLRAMDEAMREYVRISERLRHKNRAVTASIESLDSNVPLQSQLEWRSKKAQKSAMEAANAITVGLR